MGQSFLAVNAEHLLGRVLEPSLLRVKRDREFRHFTTPMQRNANIYVPRGIRLSAEDLVETALLAARQSSDSERTF